MVDCKNYFCLMCLVGIEPATPELWVESSANSISETVIVLIFKQNKNPLFETFVIGLTWTG